VIPRHFKDQKEDGGRRYAVKAGRHIGCVYHVHCSIVLFGSDICVIPGCFNRVQQQLDFHMKPQPDEMARTQTARFYIYGIGAVSKSTLIDVAFITS